LHTLLLRYNVTIDILLHLLLVPPNERQTDIERNWFPFGDFAILVVRNHHLGEFTSEVIFFVLSHGVRVTTSRFSSFFLVEIVCRSVFLFFVVVLKARYSISLIIWSDSVRRDGAYLAVFFRLGSFFSFLIGSFSRSLSSVVLVDFLVGRSWRMSKG
jgi:hypothetical protein